MRPQENGNRTGVRDLTFEAPEGALCFTALGADGFSFSAHQYTDLALHRAAHLHELPYGVDTVLHIDAAQCGVGGDMPGVACLHEPYVMKHGHPFRIDFTIRGSHIKQD